MARSRLQARLIAKIACYGALAAVATLLVARWVAAVHAAGVVAPREECLALDPEVADRPAARFALPGLDGRKVSLRSLRGKVVLLHFWFTRCPPCVAELPSLARLRASVRHRDFALVTVAVDEAADVKRFLEKHRLGDLPVLLDPERTVPVAYGTEKYPESYLIDRRGQLRYRFVNQRDWSSAEANACIGSLL